jgi:hypothetical protein
MFLPCTTEECEPHRTITYDPVEDVLYCKCQYQTTKQQWHETVALEVGSFTFQYRNSRRSSRCIHYTGATIGHVRLGGCATVVDLCCGVILPLDPKSFCVAWVQRTGELQVVAANLTQAPTSSSTSTPSKSGPSTSTVSLSTARFGATTIGMLYSKNHDIAGTQLRVQNTALVHHAYWMVQCLF